MTSQEDDLEETSRRYVKPYTGKHPIPTIQGYRQHRKELQQQVEQTEDAQHEPEDDSKPRRAYDTAKAILKGDDDAHPTHEPYSSSNRNRSDRSQRQQQSVTKDDGQDTLDGVGNSDNRSHDRQNGSQKTQQQQEKSATENAASAVDPRQKRKAMKHAKRTGGREVTDPVTHLPIVIHDETEKDLKSVPENEPEYGTLPRSATGISGASKDQTQLDSEQAELQGGYDALQKTFPPPDFEDTKKELAKVYKLALTAGLSAIALVAIGSVSAVFLFTNRTAQKSQWRPNDKDQLPLMRRFLSFSPVLLIGLAALACCFAIVFGVGGWAANKVEEVWNDETWDAARREEIENVVAESELPESVQWLNNFLASVWPLINPDLFASLVDTLEDVMQASLPKVVRMVSVDDMGQGSEAIRILGVRWLPTGAASRSVDSEGNLKPVQNKAQSDRVAPGEGQEETDDNNDSKQESNNALDSRDAHETETEKKQHEQEQQAIREGMEAEEGDFVNMELAFSYRTRSSGKTIKSKAKNAHLYLKFYLPGGIAVPVWVELRGIVGIMRLRLQLTPDPPFISLCTLTFLGQPKADLSCVPLSKHSLNLMDVPLISSFVQSAIDAALAEYVAPKSLTLDLKDMLVGEDFKKDTQARGVVWILIKKARDFKQGDGGIGPIQGSSDSYVTVSWGKFGKPVASTRIIVDSQEPDWHEWSSILVSPEEINADEKLRLQLWDSDKWSADDDLGRVEVDLSDLMHNPKTQNSMFDREDRFTGQNPEEKMPGTLVWSVGYFEKTHITKRQLEQQTVNKDIQTKEGMKNEVAKISERKLREASKEGHDKELRQQKVQDYKEMETDMIISAPPSDEFLSGILSIQIHNITGLEVQKLQKEDKKEQGGDREDEAEQSNDMPDSYCTIILNQRKIYRTRTKPKNAKPFFNAGTERFVTDWKTSEVIVSVRDSREREDDALLGVVYLPLSKVFEHRSQVMANYPLVGGIGYGRARISMVWRSVELKLPAHLRGWEYGTLEVMSPVKAKADLQEDLRQHRIKLRTSLSRVKMQAADDSEWRPKSRTKSHNSVFLAVRKRYAHNLFIEFRQSSLGSDKTPAFAVIWLSEIPDEEETTVTLNVWKGGKKQLERAQSCCDYAGSEEGEKPLGEIELTIKFWRGLSGYHKSHASKSKNADVRNVMECLDVVNDEKLNEDSGDSEDDVDSSASSGNEKKELGEDDGPPSATRDKETRDRLKPRTNAASGSDSSDSDAGSAEDESHVDKIKQPFRKIFKSEPVDGATSTVGKVVGLSGHNDSDDGERGLRAQVRDYKDHHKELHRKHRGVMQWKSARTLDWGVGKAKRMRGKVGEMLFEHGEKEVGIETEV